MDANFLTAKGPGGIPNWLIGVGGVGVAIVIGAYRKKAAATAASSATNPATQANQTPPNVFVVPGATPSAPAQSPPTVGRDGPPDLVNSGGQDIGTYRFGADEITYLTANKGNFGITDQIITDVQKAYAQVSQTKGQGQADMYHYSWLGKGNVQAIPRYANTSNDILMNLP